MSIPSNTKAEFESYKNPTRSAGSQSEIPTLVEKNGEFVVGGYQRFSISKSGDINYTNAPEKIGRILNFLKSTIKNSHQKSFLDIGCSAGLLPMLASKQGFRNVRGIDHDSEYIELFTKLIKIANVNGDAITGPWNALKGQSHDIVTVLALVHWIYSMTDKMGSFWQIFEHLRTICSDTLVIEFVDTEDPAILDLKHLSANTSVHVEPYTHANFLYAARAVFGREIARIASTPTRYIHVFKKEMRYPGYSSYAEIADGIVIKRFRPEIISTHAAIFNREVQALKKIHGHELFPMYFFSDHREIHMSYAGSCVLSIKQLTNGADDAKRIISALRNLGIRHNDINPNNLCVSDGRLRLIDFGWATLDGTTPHELPPNVGVDQGVRLLASPIDDAAMMDASIELLKR